MRPLDIEEIRNMTDEEVSELNRQLGKQALKKFALLMGAKWVLIFGSMYIYRKIMEREAKKGLL